MFRVFILAVLMIACSGTHATQVVFISGVGDEQPRELISGDDSSICRGRSSVQGLDKTRRILGLPSCSNEETAANELAEQIDLLVLVDDRRGVDDDLGNRIDSIEGEVLTCATSGPRKRVYPSYVVFNQQGSQLRALIVGEEMIDTYFSETDSDEPWSSYINRIIQRRLGSDASPDSGPHSPSISTNAANGLPAGKGLFQNRPLHRLVHNRYRPNKMDHMASRFHDNGLNWFAVSAPVGEKCEGRLYTEFIRFGHPTFQTFIWMLNHAEDIDGQIDRMIRAVKNTGSQGFIIDIEGQAFRRHAAEARVLYQRAREKAAEFAQAPGGWPLSVGITVIGFPRMAPYLNEEDLRAADFIMPQIYNRADNLSSRNIQSRIDYWTTTFAERPVIPLAGAHHCDPTGAEMGCGSERPKNGAEFESSVAPFREREFTAIGWWRYGSVENGNHWQQIRDFELNTGP